jgi:hypothetical protein
MNPVRQSPSLAGCHRRRSCPPRGEAAAGGQRRRHRQRHLVGDVDVVLLDRLIQPAVAAVQILGQLLPLVRR